MYFLTFILKYLVRRKVRSLLTVTGVGVAVMAVVALVGISDGFERSLANLYEHRGVDLLVLRAGSTVLLTAGLSRLPIVNGMIADRIAPHILLQGVVVALAVGLIGGAYPAYRGATLLPTEALRHE
jgi:ABC-type antimicrobial peptide transport system permease subunit